MKEQPRIILVIYGSLSIPLKVLKTLYLIGSDGLVNQGYVNFNKMVSRTIVHRILMFAGVNFKTNENA